MNSEPVPIVAEPTPLIASSNKCAMATFSLCLNVGTGLLTGRTKNRSLPLALLEAWWLAPALA